MKKIRTVAVDRDPASVYAFLCRMENESLWRTSVVSTYATSGDELGSEEPTIGLNGETRTEFAGRTITMRWTVAAVETGKYLAWRFDGQPWHGGGSYLIEPCGTGSKITATLVARGRGALALDPLLALTLGRSLSTDLGRLVDVLSGGPRRRQSPRPRENALPYV